MKTAIVLFCIALGVAVQATSVAEIDATPFGHNLLSTVYLQVQTGDSIDDVLGLLQEVESEIITEQQSADAAHNDFQGACSNDETYYQGEIDHAAQEISDDTNNLAIAYPEKANVEGEISEHEQGLEEAQTALATATNIIENQREAFQEHTAELLDSISVFSEARSILSQSFGKEAAFLQTGTGSKFAAHLRSSKVVAKFQPFSKILAQAASSGKLTQDSVDNILSLIDRLVSNAQDTLAAERETMQQREDTFAEYSSDLNAVIDEHQQALAALNAQLQTLVDNINSWEANLADAQDRHATYTQKLADRTAECEQESEQYSEETRQRNNDIEVINQVEDLVSNRVDTFVNYITEERADVVIS